ncbi:hypothetical protein ZPAH1_orf00391 [Aeromonas phage ZPAH1]|nr:hypothetical protein ZPAH1_orf00391 [Aeromonas phage ZPAH1]
MKATFNVNSYATVTLTEFGLEILESRWMRFYEQFPNERYLEHFTKRIETIRENGMEYRDQMHSIMNTFGEYISIGCKLPFETEIVLEDLEIVKE